MTTTTTKNGYSALPSVMIMSARKIVAGNKTTLETDLDCSNLNRVVDNTLKTLIFVLLCCCGWGEVLITNGLLKLASLILVHTGS